MGGLVAALWMGLPLMIIHCVQCNEDIVSVINRMDYLNENINQVEEKVLKQIDWATLSLRSELKRHISEHVREAIAGILQGESIEEMVRSQVITEVRQLKRGNHLMKRQLNNVFMSVRDVREEMNTYKEALERAKRDASEMKVCSKYVVDSEMQKRDLEKCKISIEEYTRHAHENVQQDLEKLNQTYQLHMKEWNTSAATTQGVTSSSEPTTTSTPVVTSVAITPKPEEERSRIIIAPMWSSTQHQFRQLNIHSNTVTTYPLRSLKKVRSVAFVSKLRKLLIGLYEPDKIISSSVDSNDVLTMRENVLTNGMAVDEEREIIFLTTHKPRYTISRMTTQGKDFSAITDLSSYGGIPLTIDVNSKEKKIYACNYGKLFMVTYDGRVLQTLATGNSILYAVTLDNTGSTLYYNNGQKLMKISLSQNITEAVTTLPNPPWSIKYYKDTIYYSSTNYVHKVGAVDVGYNIVSYTLQTVNMKSSSFALCLVP